MLAPHKALLGNDKSEVVRFATCLKSGLPYFGPILRASQGNPVRYAHMERLVASELERRQKKSFKILEIGSWAGGSALLWGKVLRQYGGGGEHHVICIDPWQNYFDKAQQSVAPIYAEMASAMETDQIYHLFRHNIRASGFEDLIIPIRASSDVALKCLPTDYFDLVYIDGNHAYSHMISDLQNSSVLLKPAGVLCGDDLELQSSQIDGFYAQQHAEEDYILDPKCRLWFHPGVTLATGQFFEGPVACRDGFWAMRRTSSGWTLAFESPSV